MGKCHEDEIEKCKKLIKKCDKRDKVCTCGKKLEREVKKNPSFHKEDLLWAFFVFRMINELLADNVTRDKMKTTKMVKEEGPENMLEFASLQDALGIKKGLITPPSPIPPPPPQPGTAGAAGKTGAAGKPGTPAKPGAAPAKPATPRPRTPK